MFADGLIFPALGLACLGWLVPRALSLFWPEGVRPLFVLGFVATVIMFVASGLFFVVLYLLRGASVDSILAIGIGSAIVHFGHLALISGLFWAPLLILSVSGLPKYWVRERW